MGTISGDTHSLKETPQQPRNQGNEPKGISKIRQEVRRRKQRNTPDTTREADTLRKTDTKDCPQKGGTLKGNTARTKP